MNSLSTITKVSLKYIHSVNCLAILITFITLIHLILLLKSSVYHAIFLASNVVFLIAQNIALHVIHLTYYTPFSNHINSNQTMDLVKDSAIRVIFSYK